MKKIFPLLIIVIGIVFSFLIYKETATIKEHHRTETSQKALDILEGELKSILQNKFFVSEAMKSYITINPDINSDEFRIFAKTLLSANPPVRAIQYADPETKVIYVYPPVGNEITIAEPMVLITDPKRGKYVNKAINENIATLQPPFELRQGGVGIVLRNPIFIDSVFYGLSIIVLDVDAIVEEVNLNDEFINYEIGYYTEGQLFFGSDLSGFEYLSCEIAVADTEWEIRLMNKEEAIDYQSYVILSLLLLIFIGIAVILFILVNRADYLAKKVEIETSRLRDINLQLNNQITLRTKSEDKAMNLLREKELLLKEIHHRLKNNLNSIKSLLFIQSTENKNPEIKDALNLTISRINSLKELYERLLQTESYTQLSVKDYFIPLISSIKKTVDEKKNIKFHIDIDDCILDTKTLFPLGIITNELITNSVKYAFPENYKGKIELTIHNNGSSILYSISDNGNGDRKSGKQKEHKGFGLSLVQMLVSQLNGVIEATISGGYKYSIEVPLEFNDE